MATFITIGYGDQEGYDGTSDAVKQAAHEHDEVLRRRGAVLGVAGKPVQVRNPDAAGMKVEQGPFLTSTLPIAGFAVIEAESIEDAVALSASTPCAVAHGVVEVWPISG